MKGWDGCIAETPLPTNACNLRTPSLPTADVFYDSSFGIEQQLNLTTTGPTIYTSMTCFRKIKLLLILLELYSRRMIVKAAPEKRSFENSSI